MGHRKNLDNFVDETRARQRNIVFPDTVRNTRSVDVFLWRGSRHPTIVQRIAAWMFGLALFGAGTEMFFQIFVSPSSFFEVVLMVSISFVCAFAGIKIFRNGFSRSARLPKPFDQKSN